MKRWCITAVATLVVGFIPHVMSGMPETVEVEKAELNGIENFSQIDGTTSFAGSRIGFGGATQPVAMAPLKAQGFMTVVNLRLADEENVDLAASTKAARAAGLDYIHLPFDTASPAADVVQEFIAAVNKESNQPVYIHCGSATRAAAVWMIGRVVADGWTIEAASIEAREIAKKPDEAIAFATAYIQALEN
jgi:uncharacterized protein (TIGR01244 family)